MSVDNRAVRQEYQLAVTRQGSPSCPPPVTKLHLRRCYARDGKAHLGVRLVC